MTYSHMGRPHTTIGDASFHLYVISRCFAVHANFRFVDFTLQHTIIRLFGCYMVKPHGQLVLVSSTPHNAYTPSLSTS